MGLNMDVYKTIMGLDKPVQELAVGFSLPDYLQKDIRRLVDGINRKDSDIACLMDELQGSLNAAILSGSVTGEQAEELKGYYLEGKLFIPFL